jgi:hypothetical protein
MEDKLDATFQRMNDLDFIDYLQASRHMLSTLAHRCLESRLSARLADFEQRMHRLKIAGNAQNKINNSILTSLVTTATDKNKQLLNRDLGPRINNKIRTRKTDKKNLAADRDQIKAAFALPLEYTQLKHRAHHHVSRLKEKIIKNQT